ncbi:MAG: hypothetical protein FWH21_05820 [Kiritimatiellaeota bacterium]|nr:hypothetical protein [Kiritimatiellota bacterium]
MVIHAHWLSENAIGTFVTQQGYDAILDHERKRGGSLIAGFKAYYGPISGSGHIATKCGNICSKHGFADAKQKLLEYLGDIRSSAWSQFYYYSARAQGDIGRENRSPQIFVDVDGRRLFDGFQKTYDYRQPTPFKDTIPCPD